MHVQLGAPLICSFIRRLAAATTIGGRRLLSYLGIVTLSDIQTNSPQRPCSLPRDIS